jgi:hypothetical protein
MSEIKVGDIVERIDIFELDPRPVMLVSEIDGVPVIALDIFGKPTPPLEASLYRVVRRADGTVP